MSAYCQIVPGVRSFAPDMLRYLDCQAATLGSQGYRALGVGGATGAVIIDAFLVITVALIGYRMLLGDLLTVREGVLTFVKIGFVLALATRWPAYQVLVYDTVLRGPAELAAQIGSAADVPATGTDLFARFTAVDERFALLADEGGGSSPGPAPIAEAGAAAPAQPSGADGFGVPAARAAWLVGNLAPFAIIRIGAGILLALGVVFVACLLFAGTRGLFLGWLRGLLALLFGGAATALVVGVELSLLEPWLTDLLARRAAGVDLAGVSLELLVATVVFDLVIATTLYLIARVAFSLQLPAGWIGDAVSRQSLTGRTGNSPSIAYPPAFARDADRSRAATIVEAVAATQRRERDRPDAAPAMTGGASVTRPLGERPVGAAASRSAGFGTPRRTVGRVSSGAGRRDRLA